MMHQPVYGHYFRLAENRGDGIFVWRSFILTDTSAILIKARLTGDSTGYVFAASDPQKLERYLKLFNEGKPSVCLSVLEMLQGKTFYVDRLEQEVEFQVKTEQPMTPKETLALRENCNFIRWLMIEKGLFDEWYGKGEPALVEASGQSPSPPTQEENPSPF